MTARLNLVLPLMFVIAACGRDAPPPEPPRPVLTQLVGEGGAAAEFSYSGEVRSRIEQPLSFRIAGKITERLVDAGAVVKPGQVIARLDPADTALSASAVEAQRKLAEAEALRYRELRRQNFVSQAALDSRETTLKAAEAQADLARNQSAYTVLKADQPGVVGQVLAEVGQVVTPGQTVVRLVRPDTLEVAIAVPETRLPEARRADTAEISLWAVNGKTYKGKIREIAAMADATTRTYAARVSILDADASVVFGMTANVRFVADGKTTQISVPLGAIFQQDGRSAVWVVASDDTVSLRAVELGRYTESAAQIASGLKHGERIVIAGAHKLTAGEKIRVASAETKANPAR